MITWWPFSRHLDREVRKAAPVTIAALRAMTDVLDRNGLAGIRDTALLVLGFALGARRSELAALDIADLSFTAEGVQVEVRTSKTRPALPYGAHSVTCPVRTTQAWLAELADYDRSSGPPFVRIDRHGGLDRTPLTTAAQTTDDLLSLNSQTANYYRTHRDTT